MSDTAFGATDTTKGSQKAASMAEEEDPPRTKKGACVRAGRFYALKKENSIVSSKMYLVFSIKPKRFLCVRTREGGAAGGASSIDGLKIK